MPIKKIVLYILLLTLSFISIVSCDSKNSRRSQQAPKVGFKAPDFTLKSVDGKEYTLSDLKGKVVFVNLWATWCPPCKEEIPSMVKLYNKLKGGNFEILAISEDTDIEAVKKFIKQYKITFPVLMDTDKKVYNLYKATAVPETHLINKKGFLEDSTIGSFNWYDKELISAVESLMKK